MRPCNVAKADPSRAMRGAESGKEDRRRVTSSVSARASSAPELPFDNPRSPHNPWSMSMSMSMSTSPDPDALWKQSHTHTEFPQLLRVQKSAHFAALRQRDCLPKPLLTNFRPTTIPSASRFPFRLCAHQTRHLHFVIHNRIQCLSREGPETYADGFAWATGLASTAQYAHFIFSRENPPI